MKASAAEHLARAAHFLAVAKDLLDLRHPSDSISRSYYATFHAARAALLELGIERSSHHGLWAAFGQFVAGPGLVDARHHHAGLRLFADRSRSDYLAEPGGSVEDARRDLAAAREFVAACRAFLEKQAGEEGS